MTATISCPARYLHHDACWLRKTGARPYAAAMGSSIITSLAPADSRIPLPPSINLVIPEGTQILSGGREVVSIINLRIKCEAWLGNLKVSDDSVFHRTNCGNISRVRPASIFASLPTASTLLTPFSSFRTAQRGFSLKHSFSFT